MEIYNVKSLDTFSSEVQSGKGAKDGGSAL